MHGVRTWRVRTAATLMVAAMALLAVATTRAGLAWVGRPFPGFFLLRNRVVASISLPGWPAAVSSDVFQSTVIAVDGTPVTSAEDVYARVRAMPAGMPFAYTLESGGVTAVHWIQSHLFTWSDTLLIFGAYLFNGLVFAAIGIGVWTLSPRRATTWAMLGLGLCCSVYVLTAMDLYGPHVLFRLHALAESFLPATLIHLTLVFPVRRTTTRRAAIASYAPAAVLAAVYQVRLDSPRLYPGVHALATVCIAAAGIALLTQTITAYFRSPSELVRQRVRVVLMGLLAGFFVPAIVFASSVFQNGGVAVNAAAFTAFVFPLSIAYAVHKRDLFEIDALVQRALYYAVLSALVTTGYLVVVMVATYGFHVSLLGQSAAFSLVFIVAVVIILPTLRDRVQRVLDSIFGRRTYDAQEVLAATSTALAATLSFDEILRLTLRTPESVLGLERVAVFLRGTAGFEEAACAPEPTERARLRRLAHDRPLLRLVATRPVLVRDMLPGEWSEDRAACLADFGALRADLIVPLGCRGTVIGFLVCGRKRAGTFFSASDVSFLRTFANHAALSLQNARTFKDLELLNADLERRVQERTQQWETSTERLASSLEQLESAYRTLQTSQEQLIAAQKMAAFGRLAASIAHEMNTPLGAALNGLKIAGELVTECSAIVDDETATETERRAAFDDLSAMIVNVEEWTRKAVSYIRSVKSHGRVADGPAAPFDVGRLLEHDLQPLLAHRLRLIGGQLELHVAPDLPELHGNGTRLGQVLANLINNAIDACEGLPAERAQIVVEALREDDDVILRVQDRGSGIAEDARPRIFDEFYTTKPPGRGTGLGLSIARDIVSSEFGGTLACTASGPDGSVFTLRLPARAARAADDHPKADAPAAA